MKTFNAYQIKSQGPENGQYWQGYGTYSSAINAQDVATGIGDNAKESYEDALEQLAMSGWGVDSLPKRPAGIRKSDRLNKEERENGECFWYVSILVAWEANTMNLETCIRVNKRVIPVSSIQGKTIYTPYGPIVPTGNGKAKAVIRNRITGRFVRVNVKIDWREKRKVIIINIEIDEKQHKRYTDILQDLLENDPGEPYVKPEEIEVIKLFYRLLLDGGQKWIELIM